MLIYILGTFCKKLKSDDTTDKYNDRLVISSFNLKKGIDYFDTYYLVLNSDY